jgi:hypothetical protein
MALWRLNNGLIDALLPAYQLLEAFTTIPDQHKGHILNAIQL